MPATPSPLIDIRPDHWAIVLRILQEHVPQYEVWAFGSRAKWTAKEYSDLDLAVISDQPLSLSVSAALADDFSESDLPWKVDVVDWATTSESFRKIIERDRVAVQEARSSTKGAIAGEWTVRPLEDCMAALIDYRGKTPQKRSFGIPLITAKVVKGGRIQTPDEFIAVDDYEPWMRRGIPQAGDVVITTEAPLGEVAQLGSERVALAQRLIALRGKPGVLDNGFLKFLLQSVDVQDQLRARASGTTVLGIKQSELRKVLLSLPAIDEQRAIAHILGTLDDKIELNRRMNETLEAMARALFKSWFVDFGPVRAKAEGRDPGLPKPLADLFPDSFEDSELGEIPKGWKVSVLNQLADVVLGGDWGGDEQDAERSASARCIRGADIPDLQIGGIGKMPVRFLKPSSLAKRRLNDGDLVIEISGGSPTQSTGRPVLVSRELLDRLPLPLVCSNFCRLLKLKSPAFSKFVYLWLRSLYANDKFLQFENGTTGIKNLAFTLFSSRFNLCVPPTAILEAFNLQVAPLFNRQQASATETDTLAALRDTLLPKLISGELRIRDAKRLIEEVLP